MRKLVLLLLLITNVALAQMNVRDSLIRFPMFMTTFAYQIPGNDLAKRFGPNSSIGGSFLYKNKHNLLLGVEGNFLFGNEVKDYSMFDRLRTNEGFLIGDNGREVLLDLYQRGFQVSASFGKIFPLWSPNRNSGFVLMTKFGYIQHKIRIQVPENSYVSALADDYKPGYDRLTDGLAVSETFGYMYFGNRRLINFFIGIEAIQALTQNKRFNFDQMEVDKTKRSDLLNGIRIGWILPLYKKVPNDFYYY